MSTTAVSAALIREEAKKQLPVYYVSQAFQGAEFNYPRIEKITFALIVASRKLRQYFQANPILVMTDQPIRKSINRPKVAGRIIQLEIELSQFDIEYLPRTAIKAQALQISSPSSHFQTKIAQPTMLNDGRSKLTVRQLKKGEE